MINVVREAAVPASLQVQEIRDYLDAVADYKASPNNLPKPKPPVAYRNSDLLEAFDRCFFKKCYLTEEAFPSSWCMDVEHFISKTEDPALVYEWTNLFPAEHRANKMKPLHVPAGGYLNPCDPADNVETEILYSISARGDDPGFHPRDPNNQKVINTCNLLNRVHNGHNIDTTKASEVLRSAISKRYLQIIHLIIEWQAEQDLVSKHSLEMQLRGFLSRKASFTMILRSSPMIRKVAIHLFD